MRKKKRRSKVVNASPQTLTWETIERDRDAASRVRWSHEEMAKATIALIAEDILSGGEVGKAVSQRIAREIMKGGGVHRAIKRKDSLARELLNHLESQK